MGTRVLPELLATRHDQQLAAIGAHAPTLRFREAMASGNQATIAAALHEHARRASADLVSLADPETGGTVSLVNGEPTDLDGPIAELANQTQHLDEHSTILLAGNALFDAVIVPVQTAHQRMAGHRVFHQRHLRRAASNPDRSARLFRRSA